MKDESTCEVTFDGTYDHTGWHANLITATGLNPKTKHCVWRGHKHKDLGTSSLTKKIPIRTYLGTAKTAERDLMEDMIEDFKDEGNPITHMTIDGDQRYVFLLLTKQTKQNKQKKIKMKKNEITKKEEKQKKKKKNVLI